MTETFEISRGQASAIIADQCPQWAGEPVLATASTGTDNVIYRIGETLCARFPKVAWAASAPAREYAVLRALRNLPLQVPVPEYLGAPDTTYPWPWIVQSWIPGVPLGTGLLGMDDARLLAQFLSALSRADTHNIPDAGKANHYRGTSLSLRDEPTARAIVQLGDEFDVGALSAAWRACRDAPAATGPFVLVHGDLQGGNLLLRNGHLSGVIDFGLLGCGDAAVDYMPAWSMMGAQARRAFRDELNISSAGWLRAKGWALSVAAIALAYYRKHPGDLVTISRRTLHEVLAEQT